MTDETATMHSAADWHWQVGADATRHWSSAARAYVAATDRPHTRIASEAELRDVLDAAGCGDRAPGYVPRVVSLWQAREALRLAGLFETANTAIFAAGGAALAAWEYGSEVRRDAPLIQQVAALLQLPEAAVDALFVSAAALEI